MIIPPPNTTCSGIILVGNNSNKGGHMGQTVIGFFKDSSDANKAVSQLESKGISRQQVDVSRGQYLDATADREGRNTNKITDFFNKLFGHDSDDAKRYSTIGQSDVSIVTVHAASHDMAEDIADILDDCGALDVDEHASRSGQTGSTRTERMSDTGSDQGSIRRSEDRIEERSDRTMGNIRRRSRIIDRTIEDDYRLRGDSPL